MYQVNTSLIKSRVLYLTEEEWRERKNERRSLQNAMKSRRDEVDAERVEEAEERQKVEGKREK